MSPASPVVSPVELELELLLVLSSLPVLELVLPPLVLLDSPPEVVPPPATRQKPSSSQVASASQQLESSAHHNPADPTATHVV